ncbi:hypothetical protein K431DRAFT_342326 [Polychaeton citri CBS 116435]|uniref:L-dopachrome isomerase n=1 Tax=Polychaeton citri CBS 116435 TaxID=1314669 RepID=A0A9P4URV8_9PEZI|nr:hypothetical protein K431DRAFT_342326 [Polychaeton citri CBS 116435]
MPHSTRGSIGSNYTLEIDVGTMAGSGPQANNVGAAISPSESSDRKHTSSLAMDDHRRSSIASAYESLVGGSQNFMESTAGSSAADKQSRRSSRNSMNGRYAGAFPSEQYTIREMSSGARDRVARESPVIAELRTNVIIKDEFTLVTDLSYHLAQRYSRPDSSIMINVDHSACLALAGTFEPCYILTVNTVPSQMSPASNKRNAALIQSFMADILSVAPDRGIVRFIPIPEENFAMNGNTMLGEIERLEKTDDRRSYAGANPNRRSQSYTNSTNKRNSMQVVNDQARPNAMSLAEKRRSIPSGVYELAVEDERPSTSHGTYAAENGLRLNGISREDLLGKETRTPNGRPKTFGGTSTKRESTQKGIPTLPNGGLSTSTATQPRQANIPISPKPVHSNKPSTSASASVPKNISRTGSTATSKTTNGTDSASKRASEARPSERQKIEQHRSSAREPTANTAKRRSTITATPKMPPPPPEPIDKSDTKSQKVSKRKSFLSAFRR